MTSTVAEHWCAGSTTRNIPWLNELVPEPVLELPIALAEKLDVKSVIGSASRRRAVSSRSRRSVTPRMKALKIGDREVTVVWMPYSWGFQGLSTGPSVNHLTIDARIPAREPRKPMAVPRQRGQGRSPRPDADPSTEGTHDDAPHTAAGPIRATLIDISNCIGCRACQWPAKQWNEKDGEKTEFDDQLGFQNPATLSANTFTLIAFHEMENPEKPGGVESAFVMQRCLHCLEPACVSACPTTALYRQSRRSGVVRTPTTVSAAATACWRVPGRADRRMELHALRRSRSARTAPTAPLSRRRSAFNGSRCRRLQAAKQFADTMAIPACVKACPADASALRHP